MDTASDLCFDPAFLVGCYGYQTGVLNFGINGTFQIVSANPNRLSLLISIASTANQNFGPGKGGSGANVIQTTGGVVYVNTFTVADLPGVVQDEWWANISIGTQVGFIDCFRLSSR